MFFEIGSDGHRLDYVQRLLSGLAAKTYLGAVVFVLTPDFKVRLDDELLQEAQRLNAVDIVYTTQSESDRCQRHSGVRRRINTTRVFEHYLKITNADLGFVNYLDPVLAGLVIRMRWRTRASVAGILFRPSVHYSHLNPDTPTEKRSKTPIRSRMVLLAERLTYRISLRQRRLTSILSLDPLFPEYAGNRYRKGEKVSWLPEPYSGSSSPPKPESDFERITLTMFGHISRRKGPLETLRALEQLSPDIARRVRLVVAGRIEEDLEVELAAQVHHALENRPQLEIDIQDEFIPDQELDELLRSSDVILAPYRKHVGSSGVLVIAAHHHCPVISQRFGLMGALVTRHDLGLTCDPENVGELANCIRQAVIDGPQSIADAAGMETYAGQHSQQLFLEGVFTAAGLMPDPGQSSTGV